MPEDPLHDLRASLAEATKEELLELLLFNARTLLELRDGLTEATRLQGGKSAAWDRVSVHQALHALSRYLHAHGLEELSAPLALLNGALLTLDHGRIPAMLRPRADGDRKLPHSTPLRGYAAGIMDGLMKHAGMSRIDAAKWVSAELNKAGWGNKFNTVIDWRQAALQHEPEIHEAYQTIINLPAWTNDDPLAHARRLVAQLISVHPQKEG